MKEVCHQTIAAAGEHTMEMDVYPKSTTAVAGIYRRRLLASVCVSS